MGIVIKKITLHGSQVHELRRMQEEVQCGSICCKIYQQGVRKQICKCLIGGCFLRSNDIVSFDFSVIRNCIKLYRNVTKIDPSAGPTHFILSLLFH